MQRAILIFLAVAFGFSWTISEVYFRLLPASSLGYLLMAPLYMYGPALGAVCAVLRGAHRFTVRYAPSGEVTVPMRIPTCKSRSGASDGI